MTTSELLAHMDETLDEVEPALAALKRMMRTPAPFNVVAHDERDQTPLVWWNSPVCENR